MIIVSFYVENAWVSASLIYILACTVQKLSLDEKKIVHSSGGQPDPWSDSVDFYIHHNGTESRGNAAAGTFSVRVIGRANEKEVIIRMARHIANGFCEGEIINNGSIKFTIAGVSHSDRVKKAKIRGSGDCLEASVMVEYFISDNALGAESQELAGVSLVHPELVRIGIRKIIKELADDNVQLLNGWGLESPLTDTVYLFDQHDPIGFGGLFRVHIRYDSKNESCGKIALELAKKIKNQIYPGRLIPSPYISSKLSGVPKIITAESIWGRQNLNCVILEFGYVI